MLSVLHVVSRRAAVVIMILSFSWLSACQVGSGGPSINTRNPVPVALLVPYGSSRPGDDVLARSLENAARLAMADLSDVVIDLRVYNTAGDPAQAAKVAKEAVADGAKIILGPVFGAAANAVGVAAAPRNVNVLAFSNNADIAGNNVFVLGSTFRNTASRLVQYANAQGRGRIMVIHDRTEAGEVALRAVQQAASASGASLVATGSYAFSAQGVVQALPDLAATARDSGANAIVFTSDTAGALPLLAQLLPENRVDPAKIKFIGLTRWDIPTQTLSMSGLQGGWFALPDPALAARFSARYSAAYGDAPHPIAGLAYDGIAAIGALVKAGKADALTKAALTQPTGFIGVNGVFRLRADGTNERALAIAEIINSQVSVIDPAPRSFGRPGS